MDPIEQCIRGGPHRHERGNFDGERVSQSKVSLQGHSVVICAKTAEPIEMVFGLPTGVGRRNRKFNRIHQVAPIGHVGVNGRIELNRRSAVAMRSYILLPPRRRLCFRHCLSVCLTLC